ncbi:hypothetical protein [Bacillus cereus]|uniref:hypothetical protein n=1 Tax=Bacillus cereus TaxID=1396 RepID=UPI000B4BD4A0|nr:hypothetical protein [Bacillus cereus]
MILAKIAGYILAVVVVLGLSVKLLWLFFIMFMYRTFASLIPFEWLSSHIGLSNHLVYFIIILVLSAATYGLLLRFTIDLPWIRYIVLMALMLWVFTNYTFADVFLFKDYLVSKGMWGVDFYLNQIKELFKTSPDAFADLFKSVFEEVFGVFSKLLDFVTSSFK